VNIMSAEDRSGITLLGLGPGDANLLTRQAWEVLQNASDVYLRTRQHPAVAGLPAGLHVHSFDAIYETEKRFEDVYRRIVAEVLALGQRPGGVIYAVPGHPFVAEATGPEIARQALEMGIPLRVVEGISFMEPLVSALGLDPFPQTCLVDALGLVSAHVPSFSPNAPAIIAQIHSQAVASDLKLTLNALYPDEHPVQLVHAAGTPQQIVEHLKLYEIDRSPHIGLLTALYLPALGKGASFEEFQEIIAHLRAPDGCPWDKEQTHKSLRPHLLEEAYETLAALDQENPAAMAEEFGDLLLQIVLHAQIASEDGEFNMAGILTGIYTKIVRRHPHVFGDADLQDVDGVLQNWERLKAQERAENGKAKASLLDGISVALPALVQAEEFQKRTARVGFDWPEIQGVVDKVEEEMEEVRTASQPEEQAAEIGDLLFAVVNLARWYKVDAESALRESSARFRKRFSHIEKEAMTRGKSVADLSLQEMDDLWNSAKKSI
jgi:tetrapyrrole methylase family protein/MazG family protein